jgi:aryl-alcohol dehydrogenase-like predicted oxidoreductase
LAIKRYRQLGQSGLVVSPLALGTMTFGTATWGAEESVARAIWDEYVEAGGNFIDTANVYANGASEEMVGRFAKDMRERLVIATKAGFPTGAGHPSVGGNSARHLHAALDASLRRLGTDHVDLYWVHVWDQVTPAAEVLETLAALIRAGKIRYYGLSNVPAWYAARICTLADAWGMPRPIALQLEYSLVQRGLEYEHRAMARECGLDIVAWAPLAGGFLSGKYRRPDADGAAPAGADGESNRLTDDKQSAYGKFSDRNWAVLDEARAVAEECGAPLSHVAIAWLLQRKGVGAALLGASKPAQMRDNLAALGLSLTAEQVQRLDTASAAPPVLPFAIFSAPVRQHLFGGCEVTLRG